RASRGSASRSDRTRLTKELDRPPKAGVEIDSRLVPEQRSRDGEIGVRVTNVARPVGGMRRWERVSELFRDRLEDVENRSRASRRDVDGFAGEFRRRGRGDVRL